MLVNQGEFFASSGIIFLQPDYVTRLLKPLVDHRMANAAFRKSLITDYENSIAERVKNGGPPQRTSLLGPATTRWSSRASCARSCCRCCGSRWASSATTLAASR